MRFKAVEARQQFVSWTVIVLGALVHACAVPGELPMDDEEGGRGGKGESIAGMDSVPACGRALEPGESCRTPAAQARDFRVLFGDAEILGSTSIKLLVNDNHPPTNYVPTPQNSETWARLTLSVPYAWAMSATDVEVRGQYTTGEETHDYPSGRAEYYGVFRSPKSVQSFEFRHSPTGSSFSLVDSWRRVSPVAYFTDCPLTSTACHLTVDIKVTSLPLTLEHLHVVLSRREDEESPPVCDNIPDDRELASLAALNVHLHSGYVERLNGLEPLEEMLIMGGANADGPSVATIPLTVPRRFIECGERLALVANGVTWDAPPDSGNPFRLDPDYSGSETKDDGGQTTRWEQRWEWSTTAPPLRCVEDICGLALSVVVEEGATLLVRGVSLSLVEEHGGGPI